MESVIEFLTLAQNLERKHSHLHLDITRTHDLGYLAWMRESPAGDLICSGRGKTANEACKNALAKVKRMEVA